MNNTLCGYYKAIVVIVPLHLHSIPFLMDRKLKITFSGSLCGKMTTSSKIKCPMITFTRLIEVLVVPHGSTKLGGINTSQNKIGRGVIL